MTMFLLLALLTPVGQTVLADDTKFTKIENPDLVCETNKRNGKTKVAFDSRKERAWLTDPGKENGLELEVKEFTVFRHNPYEWRVKGDLVVLGHKIQYIFGTKNDAKAGKKDDVKLKISIINPSTEKPKVILKNVPCKVTKETD